MAARSIALRGLLLILMTVTVMMALASTSSAQLSTDFYSPSCPGLDSAVKQAVQSAIDSEKRVGASIVRLFFHDSLLLDDTATFQGEKTANPNNGSVRGFEVIDAAKSAVEKLCPGVVSCADILAIAARDSVVILGGQSWDVKVGRRDSTTASFNDANNNIPPPTSGLANLTSLFAAQGLSQKDMVALSGTYVRRHILPRRLIRLQNFQLLHKLTDDDCNNKNMSGK
jgi:peroxidase